MTQPFFHHRSRGARLRLTALAIAFAALPFAAAAQPERADRAEAADRIAAPAREVAAPAREPTDRTDSPAERRSEHEQHDVPDNQADTADTGRADTAQTEAGGEDDQSDTATQADLDAPSRSGAPLELAIDRAGHEFRAGEVVVLGARGDAERIAAAGLPIISRRDLPGLGGVLLTIGRPGAADPELLRSQVSHIAPGAAIDLNHVYTPAGVAPVWSGPSAVAGRPRSRGIVGLVDTGLDPGSAGLGAAVIGVRTFAPLPLATPRHGTLVAYLAARQGARMLAAAVFTRDQQGREVASVDAMARAVDWLMSSGASVINLSLEGPHNQALAEIIRRAQAKGCVVVAAAGNRGPAAPPVYPAAYPAVVAVTAVDAVGGAYVYANRGDYIMFAARGVDVPVPPASDAHASVSGTSFAAPVVAAMVAGRLARPDPGAAAAVLQGLAREARHLGPPGRNSIYGYGLLGN